MKKISIVGTGTAGSFSAAHFYRWTNWDIDWYFDPNIPNQTVGEGSTLVLPMGLYESVGFTYEDLKSVDGHFKVGVLKKGWGDGRQYVHNFYGSRHSYHFNAVKLQQWIKTYLEKSNRVRIISKNVNVDDLDSDFVFMCSGRPKTFEDFIQPESISVNAVHVTQCAWEYPKFPYTLTLARPYGWVFGIPLQNRCAIGYLYNHNFNTKEEILEDVKEVFEEYGLMPSDITNSFHFDSYYRKNNFVDRVAYNGNASFFLEPIEATSIAAMDMVHRTAYDYFKKRTDAEEANEYYRENLRQIENVIMLHYAAGSIYKTPFWEYASERGKKNFAEAKKNVEFIEMLDAVKKYKIGGVQELPEYGTWSVNSFWQNLTNLGLLKS